MKDYYIFPTEGNPIKIEKHNEQYKITVDNPVWFAKEKLVEQLTKFLAYLEKYGNDGSN